MRTKNIVLPIVVFAFAISGAFATVLAPEWVYIRAIMDVGEEYECINCGVTCDNSGFAICQVVVPLRSGSSVLASTTGPLYTYRVGCATVIRDIRTETKVCPLTGNNRPISVVP